MPLGSERARGYVAATLKARIPIIIKTAAEGQDAEAVRQLDAIARSIAADGPMVLDYQSWPLPGWDALAGRVNGKRPSEAPFFDFEYWLYFRILKAVRYPETRTDPFRSTKHKDLERHIEWAEQALAKTHTIADALNLALDANAHDLSQISGPKSRYDLGRSILDGVAEGVTHLNIIADNFGGEFVADLILATIAAEAGIEVVVHVKHLPMFVSDVTTDDVVILFDRLRPSSEFSRRLQMQVDRGGVRLTSNAFWAAPKFLDQLPLEELGTGPGVLNVLKGDLNFRRAIGDASVPIETPFENLPILPAAPMLALRSIKSYCVANMKDWPAGLNRENFPMDGSIVLAQQIPAATIVSA
ncbi:MAG: ARMT1-like domain-containing protein [Devosia sp.]